MKNILFLGGGRRVSLARRFKEHGCNIYAYELNKSAPIAKEAVLINGLSWDSPDITKDIKQTCNKYDIDLLLSLRDEASPIASQFLNCPTSCEKSNNTCLDKKEFESFCYDNKILYPWPEKQYKVIRKPRFGFGSTDISKIEYADIKDDGFIYQKFIDGIEYSVDCYFNQCNLMNGCVPRTRRCVTGGEVTTSTTISRESVEYKYLYRCCQKIGACLDLRGPICMQFIGEGSELFIMEINARFGGGVILSLEAGCDMVQMIIDEYIFHKEPTHSHNWKENLTMQRYFDEHFYQES